MELHLSLTLIPVIQKSTITSYGVIGFDVIIKRQVFCLSVAADQDSKTKDYPMSDIVLYIYLYTTAPDSQQKQFCFLFKYLWMNWLAWHNETNRFHWVVQQKKKERKKNSTHLARKTGSNTLKSLSKIKNKRISITIYPMLGIYRHLKNKVKPATFL